MKQRRTTKPADEAIWFAGGERVAEVGLLRARYERQFFPRHSHDGFVSCVNERGARRASPSAPMFRFGHRGRFPGCENARRRARANLDRGTPAVLNNVAP
jgi:hypothetical protein